MNRSQIRRFGPALMVLAVLILLGLRYRDPLQRWFLLSDEPDTAIASNAGPATPASQPASQPASEPASQPVSQPASQPASMPSVTIDERRRQLIGVKTALVERRTLSPSIRAVGRVTVDETRVADVTLKLPAWIGEVFADFTGKEVRPGEPLFTFYAPELYSAQAEYLEALRQRKSHPERAGRLVEAARTRLRLWDVGEEHLKKIEEAGRPLEHVTLRAPAGGTIIEKDVFAGGAVEPGARLYRIADLSRVWIEAEIYEADLARVALEHKATVTSAYDPALRIEGSLTYIYPYLDEPTRTGRVRIVAGNEDGRLKPGMYVNASILTDEQPVLAVPRNAVIYAGERRVAFRDLGEGRLLPVRVETGLAADGWIEIRSGLEEGERIVTDANFLVAAESNLSEALKTW